ncbi:putative Hybrid PKS-NRPS biosynthetic cluster [Cytospora paraplurivora]|uniref:Hybrid PKS-NRPS biosynthetic cluster n=1 Tax=Cytospora paraplurivora TaxID=2898453 RepID=A0AAN9U145_9PEZI
MMASTHEEIAVIGSGCRFPSDANTPSRLWELIENPRDVAQKIDRFNVEGFYNENGQISGHSNVKHAYLLTGEGGYRSFDAGFFGISPLEANVLDPQTRLLLETVYEALESAGQTLEGLRGSDTAVYAGQMTDDYAQLMGRDPDTLGSNLLLDPQCFIAESSLRMLSPNGKSRMWDAGADGYARGEGVAAVVLKTLSAAEADGDDIECIIRHTALNQDGKTSGITIISSVMELAAQAGDAQEAEAIYRAFFPTEGSVSNIGRDQLFVGGAKTVIGHSEGAAGLAGVLKASLALQKSVIPPNLLLDHLNPRIQPFYHNMKILKTASAWPDVTSYCAKDLPGNGTTVFTPFVFSAASEKSLARYLTDFATYARANGPMINLRDLSYTLSDRRSSLQVMSAISASSHDDLCAKLETMIGDSIATDTNSIGTRPQAKPNAKILGVFTGQGAQWATMGTELITKSAAARNILESLEGRLSRLPPGDRPAWSLKEELLKPASSSRINEAAFSQPLCTAVQILQVELLRVAGVAFSAVVGHSSGEIAAAFAAGLISSEAAICIAYYRGLYSSLALGPDSQLGSMMAVGTSAEDVQELCDDPDFAGRVYVAAQNSPQSVTLSGDRDAVEELEVVLKDERKFVRVLKVDKAYHSHHVKPCSEPYLKSMKTLNIDVTPGPARCAWFSTVYGGVNIPFMAERDMLKGPYWARNMEQPVLLMQAVQEAWVSNGPFDIALEIGPHPTLKGPVLQTLSEQSIPYTSLFVRGTSAIESMSEGLGYILSRIGSASINLRAYDTYLSGNRNVRLLKGIPSYSWNHDSEYWHESRYARTMRQRTPMHELLGHRTPNSTEQDVGWRHFLKPKEIPWMLGHQLQNQIVMPAAGFIVMAIEAALDICPGSLPTLIEVIDVDIIKALSFASEETSVEVVFFLTDVVRTEKSVSGNFKCSASESKGAQPLELIVSGSVKIHLDGHSDHILPPRGSRPGNLIKLFDKEFYKFAREVEYQYTGPFEALDMLERKHGAVRGVIHDIEATKLLIHPAVLDAAFQALSIAFASPGDGTIRTLHVPKTIQVVRIVPHLCMRELNVGASLPFDAVHPREITEMMGDIDIYPSTSPANAMVQVQGLKCVPFSRSNKNDDKETFFTVSWDVAQPEARLVGSVGGPNQNSTSTNGTKYQEEGNPSADPNGIVDSQSDLIICLVSIIKQIVHRYPHMHIFHVETSEVATVAVTLEEIDTSFSTYTLTAPSSNLLNEVKPFADTYGDRLLLRKFDPVQDADEQEFEKGAYDLVVSSSFARPSLSEQELQNYRYLLRPGGYLVALDRIEPNDCPATFVADSLLRKTGFSGLDTTTSLAEETGVMHLVFASQAVDERISFLRNPLSDPRSSIFASELLVNDLIILDGKDARTAELGVQIQNLLAPYCNNITSVKSWHDLSQIPTSPKTTVVGLDGLDQSALQCLDHSEWDSLKTTLLSIGLFVWVTAGRLAGSPHANMLVGLMRSVVRDVPGLDYHILDFEDKTDIEASPIAESLLRFKASLLWLRQGHLKVTPETEILVDGRGRAMIPRLKLSKTLNDRYNSGQRKILASATPYSERLQLRPSSTDPSYELIYETRTIGRKTTDIRGTVRVTHSLLSAVRITEYGSLFLVLGRISAFVNMATNDQNQAKETGYSINKLLPSICRKYDLDSLLGTQAWHPSLSRAAEISRTLKTALTQSLRHLSEFDLSNEFSYERPINLHFLTDPKAYAAPDSTVDWTVSSRIPVNLEPADSLVAFPPDKTYWLVGLTVVLKDTSFQDMTLDDFLEVTRPKVEGSVHLNDIFQEDTLDFFVFFSSVIGIIGRPGQANYSAANMFMASLAEKRRRQGLAASVMHIGPVRGVGYATQLGDDVFTKAKMRSAALIPMSETDVHQMFAEAILASRPEDSPDCTLEVMAGVRRVSQDEPDQPMWQFEPLMNHLVKVPENFRNGSEGLRSKIPIKTRLGNAGSREEVVEIVQEALLPRICNLFQMDPTKMDAKSAAKARLDQMGIDSLMAVELRGWLVNTFEVNVPVLRILSGISIGDLTTIVTDSIPPELVPKCSLNVNVEETANMSSSMEVETAGDSSKPLDARQQPEHIGARPKSSQSTNADASIDTRTDLDNAAPYPTVLRSFKLSFSQEMFWFVWKYLPDKTTLNHVGWTRISGKISAHELDSAIRFVGQRHESLRTCFFEETGEPRQGIMESSRLGLEVKEIQDKNEVFMIASMLRETYVFDIARGETLRVLLLSLSSTEHFVVMGLHPLVMDATSVQIFFEEMLLQYTQPGQFLDRKAPQFVEFSERQRAIFASGGFADELRFWVDEFTMPPPPLPILNLSRATSRPSQTSYENVKASLSIELDTKSHVQAVCRAHGVTPFIFYLSILRVLLLRYSPAGENEARDVTIGVSDSNRVEHEMTKCIGPFVNLLPVRLHANTSIPFVQLLQEARNKTRSALANSRLPYGALMNEQDLKQPTSLPDGSKAYPLVSDIARLSYDVSLDIVDSVKGDAELNLLLRKDLYGWDDARILAKSFGRLVNTFSKNPSLCLDEANMFEPSELQGAMRFSRGPTWPTTWSGTILHKIDEVTQRRNDEIALHCGNVKYTYKQMCEQTNQIAAALKGAGVGFGSPVAVLQEPSAGGICSFLGILRVGGIYVPLEPSMPTPRLASVVQDSRPSVILVDHRTKYMLDDLRPQMKVIDVSETFPPSKTVPNTASVDGLAAILYTSGSSGTPKGILVTHRGLLNWAEPIAQLYGLGIEKRGDGRAISELISRHGITFTCATPSEYASWLHYGKEELASCSMWRTAIAIGEPMPESLVWQFALRNSPAFALWNLYGPTETTITATSMCIPLQSFSSGDDTAFESEGPPAAGRPHPNYSVYVLDERLRPVPAGIQGEIYIGGPSVARGYVNQPELTVERFVPDVFASEEDRKHGWTMLHRTGDLGRWRSDGALLVEGRMAGDTQVKLRGLRIDLGEVEHAIVDCASGIFQEAAVSLREAADGTSGFLVAHVVINEAWQKQLQSPDDIELEISTIQRRLSDRLPQYMCPAGLLVVPSLPLTTSAKLDRKALGLLPLPQFSHAPEKSPTEDVDQDGSSHEHDIMTTTEIRLQDVWLDVLSAYIGGRKITPVTDFFHVGGSSILLLRLRSQIREVFGVDMPLIRMFEQSTLDGMARWIDHGNQVPGQKPESIDWDKETELLDSVLRVETRLNISSFRDPEIAAKTVILTGATGLLGNALLNAMVDNPFIKHIHCIAVREPLKHPHLASMDRVTLYKGDLTKPRLGLSDTDANELFSSSDAVIHCAADMSYLKTYASLRSANVQSTKEIAAMSAHTGRMVPIHYISSIGVGTIPAAVIDGYQNKSQSEDFIFRPVSVAAYKPINPCSSLGNGRQAQSTGGGYAASKWASEVFLERLSVQHPRWQITIHRPSFITPDAWDGRLSNLSDLRDQPVISPTTNSNGSSLELLQNLRHYARLLGNVLPIIPDGRMSGTWDLVPVGKVVEDVMQQLLLEISDGEQTQFQVLHHVGEVEMQLTGMSDWIKTDKETQERVQEMDLAEWASAAGEKGMHPIMVAMLQNFAVADGTVRFARVSSK